MYQLQQNYQSNFHSFHWSFRIFSFDDRLGGAIFWKLQELGTKNLDVHPSQQVVSYVDPMQLMALPPQASQAAKAYVPPHRRGAAAVAEAAANSDGLRSRQQGVVVKPPPQKMVDPSKNHEKPWAKHKNTWDFHQQKWWFIGIEPGI